MCNCGPGKDKNNRILKFNKLLLQKKSTGYYINSSEKKCKIKNYAESRASNMLDEYKKK